MIGRGAKWNELRIELDKCVILCKNCHATHHTTEDADFRRELGAILRGRFREATGIA